MPTNEAINSFPPAPRLSLVLRALLCFRCIQTRQRSASRPGTARRSTKPPCVVRQRGDLVSGSRPSSPSTRPPAPAHRESARRSQRPGDAERTRVTTSSRRAKQPTAIHATACRFGSRRRGDPPHERRLLPTARRRRSRPAGPSSMAQHHAGQTAARCRRRAAPPVSRSIARATPPGSRPGAAPSICAGSRTVRLWWRSSARQQRE